jgi:predicted ATP-grasp superfamily ATP-dependent carboligase
MKVIITDVESRKGFDVANIIERHYGFQVVLCASRNTRFQLPIIYGQKIFQLRPSDYKTFEVDLSKIIEAHPKEELVYLPVSENITHLFYQYIANHGSKNLTYLLPSKEVFALCSNKGAFQEFCEANEFPVPKSLKKDELEKIRNHFRPLIAKPKVGQGSVGLKHIDALEELEVLSELNKEQYLFQEKIYSKEKVTGAFFLCKDGEVKKAFTHDRIRTFPPEGGVTVYSKSSYNQALIDIGAKVLKKLSWNGVAMIEFMKDDHTGEWKMIEINPRLWGSVMLTAFNGSDMLKDYIALWQHQPISEKPLKHRYIRWIYPFDFLNLVKRKLSLKKFLNLNLRSTCYINFTYSSFWRSFAFLWYFTFNFHSIKRFLKKIT